MKKLIAGTIVGLVLGAAATWLYLSRHGEPPAKAELAGAKEPHETGLHLSKEQQAAAGIVIGRPAPTELKPEARGFGRVLDAAPLAGLLAEMATASSALTLSEKEFERLKSLGENASARALETAEAGARRDRIALASAQARLLAGWGGALSARADLESLTRSLIAQESALVRVAMPVDSALPTASTAVRITSLTGEASPREAEFLGPAPSADPQAQGSAFLVLIRGQAPPPGTAVAAWFPTGEPVQNGFLLPRSALIQYESDMFVFVQTGEETFQRRRVDASQSMHTGILVTNGVSAEDRVVTTGAQQLLSEEFKSASSPE